MNYEQEVKAFILSRRSPTVSYKELHTYSEPEIHGMLSYVRDNYKNLEIFLGTSRIWKVRSILAILTTNLVHIRDGVGFAVLDKRK